MRLDELKDMQIPSGERVELALRRDVFSHIGAGVERSGVVGYFGRIDEHQGKEKVTRIVEGRPTEVLEDREPVVVLYLKMLDGGGFEGSPMDVSIGRIERVCYLTPASR